jgi:2-oxoglutarate dehydrogenase complex dehydrogenase (E1) component-like enzyme
MSATLPYRANADFLESKYVDWKKDPGSVEPLWSSFFEGFELGMARLATKAEAAGAPLSVLSATPPRISILSTQKARKSQRLLRQASASRRTNWRRRCRRTCSAVVSP